MVVGLMLFAGLFAVYQGIRSRGATAADQEPLTCESIVGRWDWLSTGGEVAFTDQGEMHWYQIALDRLPIVSGTWTCDDSRRPLHYTLRWTQTRLVDTLTLSPQGDRLSGENLLNHIKLSAVRLR